MPRGRCDYCDEKTDLYNRVDEYGSKLCLCLKCVRVLDETKSESQEN